MLQFTLLSTAGIESHAVHNIKVEMKRFVRFYAPERTLKDAAKKLAVLVSSGDIEMHQAADCLQACYDRIEHVILKPVDLAKMLKAACNEVKKEFKQKAMASKKAIVKMCKKIATTGVYLKYRIKVVQQGLLFGTATMTDDPSPSQKHISGLWYTKNMDFLVLGQISVEV